MVSLLFFLLSLFFMGNRFLGYEILPLINWGHFIVFNLIISLSLILSFGFLQIMHSMGLVPVIGPFPAILLPLHWLPILLDLVLLRSPIGARFLQLRGLWISLATGTSLEDLYYHLVMPFHVLGCRVWCMYFVVSY